MGCIKEADSSDYTATEPDKGELSQNNQDSTADPVNVVTGAFTLSEQDLNIPTQRLALNLTRHYDSQQHDLQSPPGPFGRGWSHSLQLRFEPPTETDDLTYIDDRGARITFTLQGDRFQAPPGALGLDLTIDNEDGYSLRQIDGLTAGFDAAGRLVSLRRPGPLDDSRIELTYDTLGRLRKAEGAGNRYIEFSYDGDSPLVAMIEDHTGRRWLYTYNEEKELTRVVDPLPRVRRYTYDQWEGRVSTGKGATESRIIRAMYEVFTHHRPNDEKNAPVEVVNQYTSDGRVFRQSDALGNVTRFDYNLFTRTTFVTDPAGWTTVYGYDRNGNTTKVRKPGGGTREYIYDERKNLLAEVDELGQVTQYVELKDPTRLDRATAFGRRAIANRAEYVTLSEEEIVVGYDGRGNRPLVRDALGNTTYFNHYTLFGQPQQVIFADGSEIHFSYDARSGLPLRAERALVIGRPQPIMQSQAWAYDALGNLIRHTTTTDDPENSAAMRVVAFDYDPEGHNPIRRREWIEVGGEGESFAAEERYAWDSLGKLKARTVLRRKRPGEEPEAFTTHFGYDALGREIWQIDPVGTANCRILDLQGRVLEAFLVPEATPDLLADAPLEKRQLRHSWQYDAAGKEIAYVNPLGAEITRERDSRSDCTVVIDETGFATRFEYDRDGNRICQVTSTGHEVSATYDLAGRLLKEEDNLGRVTSWTYDAVGRLQSITEGIEEKAAITRFAYDALGRLREIIKPDETVERFVLNEQGDVTLHELGIVSQPDLYVEEYTYDYLGRQTGIRAGDPMELRQQFTTRYLDPLRSVQNFDALGNQSQIFRDTEDNIFQRIDGDGRTLNLTHNGIRQLLRCWDNDKSVDSIYAYDYAGRLLSAEEASITYRWQYNEMGRVLSHDQIVDDRSVSVSYRYDSTGRLIEKRADNAWWMRYDYAPNSPFVSRIELPERSIEIKTDVAGRVTEEAWEDGGTTRYEFYAEGTIKTLACYDSHSLPVIIQNIVHDKCRRPVSTTRRTKDGELGFEYRYDSLDRLESVSRRDPSGSKSFRKYVYDIYGNRLKEYHEEELSIEYRYDEANQLLEKHVIGGGGSEYVYDRSGNLVRRDDTSYTYDANHRLRQITPRANDHHINLDYAATGERVCLKSSSENDTGYFFFDGMQEILSVSSKPFAATAFWGFQTDTLLALSGASQVPQRAYTDAQGSVVGTEGAESLTTYDPFGVVVSGYLDKSNFGFCGKRYHPVVGWYDNRARFYDPEVGRFTQPDPQGVLDGPNLYLYANNNPVSYADPTGFVKVRSSYGQIGSVEYYSLDSLGRAVGAVAVITPDMIGTGSKASWHIHPTGFGGALAGHERGHLIAKELGGSGKDRRNLATMTEGANDPGMRYWEQMARNLVEEGNIVRYEVKAIYYGGAPIASGFTVHVSMEGKTVGFGTVLNR